MVSAISRLTGKDEEERAKEQAEPGTHVVDKVWGDEVPLRDDIGLDVVGKVINCHTKTASVSASFSVPGHKRKFESGHSQFRMRRARSVTFATESKTMSPLCLRT